MSTVDSTEPNTLDAAFLDTVTTDIQTTWTAKVLVGSKELVFKLDTGAEVTAISEEAFRSLGNVSLQKPSKVLYGPGEKPLDVIGESSLTLHTEQKSVHQRIFVIRGLKSNLLGLPAITALNLAARVDSTLDYRAVIEESYPKVFNGLGEFGEPYQIKLTDDAKPHAVYTPRRVPLPLRSKVKAELTRMEELGVISKVEEPTPWCACIVAVPKNSGSVRICVDLQMLNESVMREVHPLPSVDETLGQLAGGKVFSKLDANSGFWQIPLTADSRLLTTFLTPFGRYCFNKLPFGISSAPEHFQKQMTKLLEGLEGFVCLIDDILIHGRSQEEHDSRLRAVLERLEAAGVTLNKEKCSFSKHQVKFLGHIVDENGISADPEKMDAIRDMKAPTNITELRRFLGMANQLGKFSHNLAELSQPLRELLSKKNSWWWAPEQTSAFNRIKDELTKETVLALYDPLAETKVSADASSYGLGAVLMQKKGSSHWKPVAFASRSMTATEQRYAQIEKEALATVWACEKFTDYILGKKILIETDHKPLVPLLSTKNLNSLPPRVLRFRLRLTRFDVSIVHVPGKLLHTADALSRAPVSGPAVSKLQHAVEEVEQWVEAVVASLPATGERLREYSTAQVRDPICAEVMKYCKEGWPSRKHLKGELKPYWELRDRMSLSQDLLLYGSRIVVPASLQEETLKKIHQGHQGIQRCRLRAQNSVWWPGVSTQIKDLVERCSICARTSPAQYEPMISSVLPEYPWQKVGSDLFELNGTTYVLVVDYFSRYLEVVKLTSLTSLSVISVLKSVFSRHGIPEVLVSDNGPQYASQVFEQFALAYGFKHTTSSPYYPQGNGLAERTVKTVKSLLKKADDPYLALLSYRTTPLPWCGLSPTQLLMGRHLRTSLPQTNSKLTPQWSYLQPFRQADEDYRNKQKEIYDRRHRVIPQTGLSEGSQVWIKANSQQTPGSVISRANTPRSYWIDVPSGPVRRNRRHITVIPDPAFDPVPCTDTSQPVLRSPIMTRSRTNTQVRPPDRLRYWEREMWHNAVSME